MTLLPITRKETIWLACKAKACCYAPLVLPSGRDVWRIARALQAPPWSFLVYFQTPDPRRDAFILDHSGQQFRLALGKGAARRRQGTAPCIFLLRTRDGAHRCGLGDLRPLVCRAFPAEVVDGVLCLRRDSGCTCRTWALSDVYLAEERALVEARQAESEEYCAVVARWNARVAAAPTERSFDFLEYGEFLMEEYDCQAAGDGNEQRGDRRAAGRDACATGGRDGELTANC